jgi:hypothetical protein
MQKGSLLPSIYHKKNTNSKHVKKRIYKQPLYLFDAMHYLYIILVRTCKIERIKVKNQTQIQRMDAASAGTIISKISLHVKGGVGNGSGALFSFSLVAVASGIFFDKKQTLKEIDLFLK